MYWKTIFRFSLLFPSLIMCRSTSSNQSDLSLNTALPCDRATKTRNVLFALFCVFVLLVGITGNLLSIFVIHFSRKLRAQVAYHFIVSLAVADMGVSFFVTTLKIDLYRHNNSLCHNLETCYFLTFADYIFPMTSLVHLLVISIDRCYAITLPFCYASQMTKLRAKIIIAVVWVYGVIWASLGMFPWHSTDAKPLQIIEIGEGRFCFGSDKYYATTIATVVYIIPMVVTTLLYSIVLYIATKQAAAIAKLNPCARQNDCGRRLRRDLRAAKTVSIVFAAYIVCWLPHFITVLIGYWEIDVMVTFSKNHRTAYDAVTTLFNNILPTINSCINPFIYFIFGAQFRMAFKDLMYKLLKKPRDGIIYPAESAHYIAQPIVTEEESYEQSKSNNNGTVAFENSFRTSRSSSVDF